MYARYAHADFDDLDLDARSQWVSRGKQSQQLMLSATKQAVGIKLAINLLLLKLVKMDHFYMTLTLTLQTFI